ncbi:ADP-ribose diphosphatase [Catenovulum sp. 2E275]|uniref:ADP-ribose diphosphatase n=1 Tax=Catenovulum sp. 2E275 TaxID=2980497 RepID=UPI0021CF4FCC|nr:ADP-ribose diphosphatase [Catenovulum sp. 2E275]MCU4675324.1 ADP-ribose diphosphatase [Catenovulum sp. 2E275]
MKSKENSLPFQFNKNDVEVIKKQNLFSRFFNVSLVTFKHKLFEGGWSEPVQREIFERGDAVVVLPYDPIRDEIVLIEQVRIGAILNAANPWTFELVGGMVEQDESIESVAIRETQEETGLEASHLMPMQSYLSSCGGTSERIFLYVAKVNAQAIKPVCGLDYENEDIKVHAFPRTQVMAWLNQGQIENASALIGLHWLQTNLEKVKQDWQIQ